MAYRFIPNYRLREAGQFDHAFRFGQKHQLHSLILFTCNNSLGYARLGFAISKKRVRKAVQRNRIKRVIRECFRTKNKCLPGIDIVVLGARQTDRVSNRELNRVFSAFVQKQCEKYRSC